VKWGLEGLKLDYTMTIHEFNRWSYEDDRHDKGNIYFPTILGDAL